MKHLNALVVIVVACAVIFILAGLCPCSCAVAGPKARRTSCMSNLAQIGKACVMYSFDHTNMWPASLQDITDICDEPRCFTCPATRAPGGALSNVMAWTDYAYLPVPTNTPSSRVAAFCPPAHHDGDGGNILFADGSVGWYETHEFERIIKNGQKD